MTEVDLLCRARRAVTAEGERSAAIAVLNGRIVAVEAVIANIPAREEVRFADDVVLLPGLVDTHVHLQDPGRAEWEGFRSGTRAAAAGGITTVVDMPLDSLPVTVTVPALRRKRAAAAGRCHVDVGFWAGVTPANLHLLRDLDAEGVLGFKCFLANTGIEEFPPVSLADLDTALGELSTVDGLLLVHAELPGAVAPAAVGTGNYREFLARYPGDSEFTAVEAALRAARRWHCRMHIVHVSTGDAAALIADAKQEGVGVSAETCPHYLMFSAADVPDGATEFKVCPPIREPENRERLWSALAAGSLDMVVSDHSPTPGTSRDAVPGDFTAAPGGISSLQVSLSAMWTAARRRQFSLSRLALWMSTNPAELAGLRRKGQLAVGRDADFCVFAPDETFVVDPTRLEHRQPSTAYAGVKLSGVVRETWLRGQRVDFSRPLGRLLRRGQ